MLLKVLCFNYSRILELSQIEKSIRMYFKGRTYENDLTSKAINKKLSGLLMNTEKIFSIT